jgi:hypothetical protein
LARSTHQQHDTSQVAFVELTDDPDNDDRFFDVTLDSLLPLSGVCLSHCAYEISTLQMTSSTAR